MDKILLIAVGALLAAFLVEGKAHAAPRLQDVEGKLSQGKRIVIVIDPGHGGENRGTIENGHEEKQMDMATALAMYEELSLYDGVEVYLTHTEDVDMPLRERAEFAESVDADFLFSIHYNASANHELFGSEVWVSAFPPYNGYGYQFGYELLTDMRGLGLLVRGVKTRLGDKGLDYYGIIRESVARDIPAVIIEHCHVDEERDAAFCDSDEKLKQFGRMDATAVARYFGLKSAALGVDYSGHALAVSDASATVRATAADSTAPEVCQVELLEADYEGYLLKVRVSAADGDSPLLYYSYSTDRGLTFSPREAWPGTDALTGSCTDSFSLEIPVTPGTWPRVIVRAYNMYDLYTESVCLTSPEAFPVPEAAPEVEAMPVGGVLQDEPQESRSSLLFRFCLLAAGILLALCVTVQGILFRKRRKRRRQRRNDWGDSRNHPR